MAKTPDTQAVVDPTPATETLAGLLQRIKVADPLALNRVSFLIEELVLSPDQIKDDLKSLAPTGSMTVYELFKGLGLATPEPKDGAQVVTPQDWFDWAKTQGLLSNRQKENYVAILSDDSGFKDVALVSFFQGPRSIDEAPLPAGRLLFVRFGCPEVVTQGPLDCACGVMYIVPITANDPRSIPLQR